MKPIQSHFWGCEIGSNQDIMALQGFDANRFNPICLGQENRFIPDSHEGGHEFPLGHMGTGISSTRSH
eukprot:757557-Hanusia_phi.AAC.2